MRLRDMFHTRVPQHAASAFTAHSTAPHDVGCAETPGPQMSNISDDVRVVPLDSGVYEVRLHTDNGPLRIGKVSTRDSQHTWMWQHRDGERSSPVATTLADVV